MLNLKKIILIGLFILTFCSITSAQANLYIAAHIRYGSSLPATCKPSTGDVFFKTSATIGMYQCLTANTWTAVGGGGGTGNVTGPLSSTDKAIARFNGTNGQTIQDSSSSIIADNGSASFTNTNTTGTGATAGFRMVNNSLTTGNGLEVSSSSLTTGTLASIISTSTAAASNTQTGLLVNTSGANSNNNQTTFGQIISNSHTGSGSVNIGLRVIASGGGTNTALDVSGGNANFAGHLTVEGVTSTGSTGTGKFVFDTGPTLSNPTITNIASGADFTISQNSVAPFTSVNSGAIVDTLKLNAGIALFGTTAVSTSATSGDVVLTNNHFLRGNVSANNNTRGLIGLNSSNLVSIDSNGVGVTMAGTLAVTGHLTLEGVTSTGAAGSGKLMFNTNPSVTTGLRDTNGLALLAFTPTGSAIFGATLTNAASGGTVAWGVTTPTQAASGIAGTPVSFAASNAVAGSSNAGAVAGGNVTITAGDAARLTSGNANGGDINLNPGAGIGTGIAGGIKLGQYAVLKSYTVATLPSAATAGVGALAIVTDATLTAITGLGLAPTGSGSNKVVVYSDGTNWLML